MARRPAYHRASMVAADGVDAPAWMGGTDSRGVCVGDGLAGGIEGGDPHTRHEASTAFMSQGASRLGSCLRRAQRCSPLASSSTPSTRGGAGVGSNPHPPSPPNPPPVCIDAVTAVGCFAWLSYPLSSLLYRWSLSPSERPPPPSSWPVANATTAAALSAEAAPSVACFCY